MLERDGVKGRDDKGIWSNYFTIQTRTHRHTHTTPPLPHSLTVPEQRKVVVVVAVVSVFPFHAIDTAGYWICQTLGVGSEALVFEVVGAALDTGRGRGGGGRAWWWVVFEMARVIVARERRGEG